MYIKYMIFALTFLSVIKVLCTFQCLNVIKLCFFSVLDKAKSPVTFDLPLFGAAVQSRFTLGYIGNYISGVCIYSKAFLSSFTSYCC